MPVLLAHSPIPQWVFWTAIGAAILLTLTVGVGVVAVARLLWRITFRG